MRRIIFGLPGLLEAHIFIPAKERAEQSLIKTAYFCLLRNGGAGEAAAARRTFVVTMVTDVNCAPATWNALWFVTVIKARMFVPLPPVKDRLVT
jgi:hypothetical protein